MIKMKTSSPLPVATTTAAIVRFVLMMMMPMMITDPSVQAAYSSSTSGAETFTYSGYYCPNSSPIQITDLEIHCSSSASSYFSFDDGNNNEECGFGNYIDIQGKVYLNTATYRYMDVTLQVCAKNVNSQSQSYNSNYKKCKSYSGISIDALEISSYEEYQQQQEEQQQQQNNQEKYSAYSSNYVEAGSELKFTARGQLPTKIFRFYNGYELDVTAKITPQKSSSYSQCYATFEAGENVYGYQYNAYAAAAAAGVVGSIAAFFVVRRRRRLAAIEGGESSATKEEDATTDFKPMDAANGQRV